jgi:type IVB pilus formation R64 PilN family outer membrane protein
MLKSTIQSALALGLIAALTGCAVSPGDVNKVYANAESTARSSIGDGASSMPLVEKVSTAFLGDRLVPVAYEASLPAIFRDKTVTFPANLPITKIATLVSMSTGYPVHLSPDVYVPRDSLIPGGNTGKGGPQSGANSAAARGQEEPTHRQPCSCSVASYLHAVTEDLGLDWSFDSSTISIQRFVTKTFTIAAVPGTVTITSKLSKGTQTSTGAQGGGGGGGGGTNTGSFTAETSTGRDGHFDYIALVTDELQQLKSPMGTVTVNPQSRLVMVHDTKEAVDRMAALLQRENAISTRQVAIRVRTLQLALNDGSQAGISADVVFNRISQGIQQYAVAFGAPISLATGGGSVGLSVLRPNAAWTGTTAAVKALNSFGRTVDDNAQTKYTLNGIPVAVGTFETKGYLAQTSPSAGSFAGTTSGVPGLVPGSVTVGDFINILPSVNDHNQILLSYWSDSSKLNGPFTTISSGTGATFQQIQLPDVLGSKDDQTIALSDGQTVVMYGAVTNHYDGANNAGIGGASGNWNKQRTFQVIMLTATVVPSN